MTRFIAAVIFMMFCTVHAQRRAYVVNTLAETLSSIDLETGEVENHIVALGTTPNQGAWHDGYLYVVNSVSADVMKIDPESRQILADIYLPIGSNPYSMDFRQSHGYVTGFISGSVYRVNLSTGSVDGQVDIGGYPEGILSRDGFLFVTQTYFNPDDFSYGQGRIAVIDADDMSLDGQISVGMNPQSISLAPDGALHVVCTGNYADIDGAVYIVDPVTRALIDSVEIGGQPANLAISPYGIGYLSAGGWFDRGFIFAYDIHTGEILRGPENPIESGLGVAWVAVDSLGFLYSCDMGDDTVSKLTSTGEPLGSFGVGDGPICMVVVDDARVGTFPEDENSIPQNAGLLTNYPNPFNSGTLIELEYRGETAGPLIVSIYDIMGRHIRSLAAGTEARSSAFYWDGTDERGLRCASGIYYARLFAESVWGEGVGVGTSRKMTLVK